MKSTWLFIIITALAWTLQACGTSRNNTEGSNSPVDTSSNIPNDTTGMGTDTTINGADTSTSF